jgi:hypothetical protein
MYVVVVIKEIIPIADHTWAHIDRLLLLLWFRLEGVLVHRFERILVHRLDRLERVLIHGLE